MIIETVLDSIDAGDFGEMCLHRKIAPYQCIVYSISQGKKNLFNQCVEQFIYFTKINRFIHSSVQIDVFQILQLTMT